MNFPIRFGLGYKLTLVKAGESFEPNSLTSLVLSHVEDAEMLSAAGGEISFRLPREQSQKFPSLFRALEAGREAMGVGGYGVSITSLEEVGAPLWGSVPGGVNRERFPIVIFGLNSGQL